MPLQALRDLAVNPITNTLRNECLSPFTAHAAELDITSSANGQPPTVSQRHGSGQTLIQPLGTKANAALARWSSAARGGQK